MKKYKYLLWDLDGTVLNFSAAESNAIRAAFRKYGFGECTDEMLARYSVINCRYWEALERNEITKKEVLVGRFKEFFRTEGLNASLAESFNRDYESYLGDTVVFCEDSFELLSDLKKEYILAVVTNGCESVQKKRFAVSGLDRIFDYSFISDVLGVEKPNRAFFDIAFSEMRIDQKNDLSQVLLIGDSLTSDIRGGNNAGIDTCWYNPTGKEKNIDVLVTYEIRHLREVLRCLE